MIFERFDEMCLSNLLVVFAGDNLQLPPVLAKHMWSRDVQQTKQRVGDVEVLAAPPLDQG